MLFIKVYVISENLAKLQFCKSNITVKTCLDYDASLKLNPNDNWVRFKHPVTDIFFEQRIIVQKISVWKF